VESISVNPRNEKTKIETDTDQLTIESDTDKTKIETDKVETCNMHTLVYPTYLLRLSHQDPPMVGIRSPIGLVVGSCTSHPGVLGSIPKREEPGKTGAPCVKGEEESGGHVL